MKGRESSDFLSALISGCINGKILEATRRRSESGTPLKFMVLCLSKLQSNRAKEQLFPSSTIAYIKRQEEQDGVLRFFSLADCQVGPKFRWGQRNILTVTNQSV